MINLFECGTEFLSFTGVVNTTLQASELKIRTVEPTALVIHLGKNARNRAAILIERAFDAHIKEDSVGRHARRALCFVGKFVIFKTRGNILNRSFTRRLTVCEQVAEHLEKVRFTRAKRTANPHADFIRRIIESPVIRIEKRLEMAAKLVGHNVFVQLLPDTAVILLIDLNNTVNVSVDVVLKHIFDLHGNAFR